MNQLTACIYGGGTAVAVGIETNVPVNLMITNRGFPLIYTLIYNYLQIHLQ